MHTDSDIQQVFHNRYDITEIESSTSTILLINKPPSLISTIVYELCGTILGLGYF